LLQRRFNQTTEIDGAASHKAVELTEVSTGEQVLNPFGLKASIELNRALG
jgi:hypothetical protein